MALPGSGHWEQDSWERERGKVGYGSYCYGNNVVSLQINTASIMQGIVQMGSSLIRVLLTYLDPNK